MESKRLEAFTHQLSLTRHSAATQRRDATIALLDHFDRNLSQVNKLTSLAPLIEGTLHLMLDEEQGVRNTYVKLFKAISRLDRAMLIPHERLMILHVHSAMTHVSPRVRQHSTIFLTTLLEFCAQDLVERYWLKTLDGFAALLGWPFDGSRATVKIPLSSLSNTEAHSRYVSSLFILISHGIGGEQATIKHGRIIIYEEWLKSEKCDVLLHSNLDEYFTTRTRPLYDHLRLFEESSNEHADKGIDQLSRRELLVPYLYGMTSYLKNLWSETASYLIDVPFHGRLDSAASLAKDTLQNISKLHELLWQNFEVEQQENLQWIKVALALRAMIDKSMVDFASAGRTLDIF